MSKFGKEKAKIHRKEINSNSGQTKNQTYGI